MRILLCGDDPNTLVQLACELRDSSKQIRVSVLVAGTNSREYRMAESEDSGIAVFHAERSDLYPNHWHKSASVSVRESLRSLLSEAEFDLVHVLSWRGLTRDLVVTARTMGVPAVVSLKDDWTSCLLEERVRPDDRESNTPCTSRHSVAACLPCARGSKPDTTWVPIEAEYLAFTERSNAIKAELDHAAAIFVGSEDAALRLGRLSDVLIEREVITLNPDSATLLETYDRVVTAHKAVGRESVDPVWYEERMQRFAEEEWDEQCRKADV